MKEPKKGRGRLVSDPAGVEIEVDYDITFDPHILKTRFGPVVGKIDTDVSITPVNREPILDGEYDLYCADGEIIRFGYSRDGGWLVIRR